MMTNDAESLHRRMVDALVAEGDLVDGESIATAFRAVRRGMFLPSVEPDLVYSGQAVPTRWDADGTAISSSSQPGVMAGMLRQLSLQPGHRVLEIGTGTGYNAALMDHMVQPGGSVVSIDIDEDITQEASASLGRAHATAVAVLTADGWFGAVDSAPFDRIIVTVGTSTLSPHWVEQLKQHGLMVVPLSLRPGIQASIAFTKIDDEVLVSSSCEPCGFMGLRGVGAPHRLYEPAGDWLSTTDDNVRSTLVRRLVVSGTCRRAAIGPRPPGWFASVALMEEDAVFAVNLSGTPAKTASGIVDLESQSLAWIEESSLGAFMVAFGGTRAESRLESALARLPLDVSALQIRASRHDRHPQAGREPMVIHRGDFGFVIERPSDLEDDRSRV